MKYNITPTARGYEISATQNGRVIYLQSIYKGAAKWTLDYTYSHKYTTEKAAHKALETIKDYCIISGDARRYFLSNNPTQYTEVSGRVEVCDISEIIRADFNKAVGVIGNAYKIPREYIEPVDEAAPGMV